MGLAELHIAERDVPRARLLLQQAAVLGNSVAAHSLQIFGPDTATVTSDTASEAVLKLAQAGDTDSMNILGLQAAVRGGVNESCSRWTKSARERDVIAPLLLSRQGLADFRIVRSADTYLRRTIA